MKTNQNKLFSKNFHGGSEQGASASRAVAAGRKPGLTLASGSLPQLAASTLNIRGL